MALLHFAIANHDVFRSDADAASIVIAAGFDCQAMITRVKAAIFDEDVLAGIGIAAVSIGTVAGDGDAAHRDIAAQHGIDLEHRRILHGNAFDQNIF